MLGCLSRIRGLSAFEGWKKAASAGKDYKVSMVGGRRGRWWLEGKKRETRVQIRTCLYTPTRQQVNFEADFDDFDAVPFVLPGRRHRLRRDHVTTLRLASSGCGPSKRASVRRSIAINCNVSDKRGNVIKMRTRDDNSRERG